MLSKLRFFYFIVLLSYPLLKIYDGWVQREGKTDPIWAIKVFNRLPSKDVMPSHDGSSLLTSSSLNNLFLPTNYTKSIFCMCLSTIGRFICLANLVTAGQFLPLSADVLVKLLADSPCRSALLSDLLFLIN
jgi:hypothetical protein